MKVEGLEEDRIRFGGHLPQTLPARPRRTLHADDFSVISHLQNILGMEYYSSRAILRARQGDLVAAAFEEIPGYLNYFSGMLGLGRYDYCQVQTPPGVPGRAVFTALLSDRAALKKIQALAEQEGEFWIHPYMGHQHPWQLAKTVAERSKQAVRVLAPLPAVTRWANDKVRFAEAVEAVLGSQAVLEGRHGRSAQEIARHLVQLARLSNLLSLKLADSASGMGTGIFSSREILEKAPQELEATVENWMKAMEWDESQPSISVERWESETVGSPSIQLWIPPPGDGLPLMEGIFDQLFDPGDKSVFVGSIPSRLPVAVKRRLSDAGVRLGRLFQLLGYLGRCSFDTILKGREVESARILFTECNGRWGGTSTPMSMMNRLFGDYRRQPYVCRDFDHPRLEGVSFDEFAGTLADILFDRRSGSGWLVLFNAGCLQPVGKIDAITLGKTYEEAEQRQEEFGRIVEERF